MVLQIFSTVEAQGANGRFESRNRDSAMSEMGARQAADCKELYARVLPRFVVRDMDEVKAWLAQRRREGVEGRAKIAAGPMFINAGRVR